MSKTLIFVGGSGSGKTTFAEYLLGRKDLPYTFNKAVSGCTREARPGEMDGDAYYFISEEEFQKRLSNGEYVETTLYNGSHRGLRKSILEKYNNPNDITIVVMDINGALAMKEIYGDDNINVYLDVPKDILEQRMRARGDSEDAIRSRLEWYETSKEDDNAKKCDIIIKNDADFDELATRLVFALARKEMEVR